MKRQEVVAAVIERDGLILVARRNTGTHKGKWEFPGGKVEPGESPSAALVREINEEFGVTIAVRKRIAEVAFSVAGVQYLLLAYLAGHVAGEYRPVVHGRIDWRLPSSLPSLDLAPADVPVAELLASAGYDGIKLPVFIVNDRNEVEAQ